MESRERALLGLAIISGFVFTVATLALILQSTLPKNMCEPWNWMPYLLIIISSLGVFVGGLTHYLPLEYLEKKARTDEVKTKQTVLLNCLPEEEKRVVEILLNGPKFQSEISRETGFGKVKTHRVLKRLETRGVIILERVGKTNLVRLVLK